MRFLRRAWCLLWHSWGIPIDGAHRGKWERHPGAITQQWGGATQGISYTCDVDGLEWD